MRTAIAQQELISNPQTYSCLLVTSLGDPCPAHDRSALVFECAARGQEQINMISHRAAAAVAGQILSYVPKLVRCVRLPNYRAAFYTIGKEYKS